MGESDNKTVPASSSTPNQRLSFSSKGSDEIHSSYQEKFLNVENLKKPATKHFISPTISAASKANPPRKKILAERNQSPDTDLQKIPTFTSEITSATELGEKGENALHADLPCRRYDLLTNYHSPRPKFLRYKPNRRRDIFLRREYEAIEGKNEISVRRSSSLESKEDKHGEGESATSTAYGTEEDNMAREGGEEIEENKLEGESGTYMANGIQEDNIKGEAGEEIEGNEEEFDEVEEETCRGSLVVKFLLLLVVLVLCTSYISTVNSPTPSPVVQAVGSLKNVCHMIQVHVYGSVKNLETGNASHTLVQKEGLQGFTDIDGIDDVLEEAIEKHDGGIEALQIIEEEEQARIEEFGGVVGIIRLSIKQEEKSGFSNLGSVLVPEAGKCADVREPEVKETAEVPDEAMFRLPSLNDGFVSLVTVSSPPYNFEEGNEVANESIKQGVAVSDEAALSPELQKTEAVQMFGLPSLNDGFVSLVMVSSPPYNLEEGNEVANEPIKQGVAVSDEHTDYYEIQSDEAEENPQEVLMEPVVGFFILLMAIAGLALVFNSKRKRSTQNNVSPIAQPTVELMIPEKCISLHSKVEDKNIEHLLPFSDSANLMEESCSVKYKNELPSIQLLGEFEVGEMSRKSRMIGDEASSQTFSVEKRMDNNTNSLPVPVQPAFSDMSIMDSTLYGSFTNERKIVKEQEGAYGEFREVVSTPVRRSSRIRNRSISSTGR